MQRKSPWVRGVACVAALVAGITAAGCGGSGSSSSTSAGGGSGSEVKVGFVTAFSGSGAINSVGNLDGLKLAVKELNGDKALAGHHVTTVTGDDTTDPGTASQVCQRFVVKDKVQAIVGNQMSSAALACQQIAQTANIPYISAAVGSTEVCKPNYFASNQSPKQAALPGLDHVLKTVKPKRVYLIGSDYASPKATFALIRPIIQRSGAKVVGTGLYPLGTSDFSVALSKIRSAHPDAILSAEVAADNVAFHKAIGADPKLSKIPLLDFVMKPQDAKSLGRSVDGVLSSTLYDPGLTGAANADYKHALTTVGKGNEPYGGFFVYTAMHLIGDAISQVGGADVDGKALIARLATAKLRDSPIGPISVERHYLKAPVSIVRYDATGTSKVIDREAAVSPGVSCPAS